MAPEVSKWLRGLAPQCRRVDAFVLVASQCISNSCFDLFDCQITEPAVWRSKDSHIVVLRRPNIGISRAEQQSAICAGSCRKMRDATVVSDEDGAFKHRGQMRQRQVFNKPDTTIFPRALQLLGLCFVRLARNHEQGKTFLFGK